MHVYITQSVSALLTGKVYVYLPCSMKDEEYSGQCKLLEIKPSIDSSTFFPQEFEDEETLK